MTDPGVSADSTGSGLRSRWPLGSQAAIEIGAAFTTLATIGLVVGWLLLGPLAGTALARWDRAVATWFTDQRDPTLNMLTDLGSAFSDTFNIILALAVLLVAMTMIWKRWRESLTLGIALGLEASVFLAVSSLVGRSRPPVDQLDPSPPTAAFPSGHTGAAVAFYVGLAVIVYWTTERLIPRVAATLIAVLIPAAVAVSRVYRGMHYITDVIVGVVLGLACIAAAVVIVKRAIARREVAA